MGSTRAEPLVDADADRPIRVAVLASEGDARLRYLLEDDPDHGETYELVGGFVNAGESAAADLLEDHGVPVETRDIHDFYDERGAPLSDMDVRRAFDERVAETLAGYDPDLVVLSGYLHVVTAPVPDRFFPRIVNVHHGDLTVRDESGEPVYTGLNAVEDAVRAGEASTHETTHLVTEDVDRGPLVARSRPFTIHRDLVADVRERGAEDVLSAYVYAHRAWMIREGGGPTLAKTIDLVADGRVAYDPDEGATYVDGRRGYYQLGEGVVVPGAGRPVED
ncbi:MAG: formyltransferase family protein [Haloferacaceae archaeon]